MGSSEERPCPVSHWASLSKARAPEAGTDCDSVRNARDDLRPTSCMAGMEEGCHRVFP